MRLLMAGPARIRNKRIIAEPHKRRPVERLHGNSARRYVDLSHVIADGVVTYPGLPAVHVCDYLSREQSRDHYEAGTEFQIASIEMSPTQGPTSIARSTAMPPATPCRRCTRQRSPPRPSSSPAPGETGRAERGGQRGS